jgi:hypothetical protein
VRVTREGAVAAAAGLLGAEDVEATLKEPPRIRQVDLFLIRLVAALAQFGEGDVVEPVEEDGIEHPVDPPTSAGQELGHRRSKVTPGTRGCGQAVSLAALTVISRAHYGVIGANLAGTDIGHQEP